MASDIKRQVTVVVTVLLLAALMPARAALATFPGQNGRIAFGRLGPAGWSIWTMDPGGSDQRRLTWSGDAFRAQWSPDGSMIAYQRRAHTFTTDIWVMNADGTRKHRITHSDANDNSPAWSPDGMWLAFASDRRGTSEIYKIRTTRPFAPAIRLTSTPDPSIACCDASPDWSPLGTEIVFTRFIKEENDAGGYFSLYRVAPDGSWVRQGGGSGVCPSWGPAGVRVAWIGDDGTGFGPTNVYRSYPDGTQRVQVTHYASTTIDGPWVRTTCPSWSPDHAAWIVYGADPGTGEPVGIYRIRSDGTGEPRFLAGGTEPDWGPLTT